MRRLGHPAGRVAPVFVFGVALGVAPLVLAPSEARAEPKTLSGEWTASGLSESWAVSDWGAACGPRPGSQGAPGGPVHVKQVGSELAMSGAGHSFSTGGCWDQMPGLARTSHSGGSRGWRTTCATAANDSRQAQVVTSLSATDSSIVLQETGTYQFVIQGQTCKASVTRGRTMTLVRREGEAEATAPTATAAPAKAEKKRCDGAAGEPARLEVRPGKKLLKAGDSFTFRAIIVDAEGCGVRARPTFRVVPGPLAEKTSVDASGKVTIADGATDGRVELVVSVRDKSVTIPIDVTDSSKYDAMLARRVAGDDEAAAVATLAAGGIGGSAAVVDDAGRRRKTQFIAIIGGLAALLAFAGLFLWRRGRGRRVDAELDDEAPASVGYRETAPPASLREVAAPSPTPVEDAPADPEARSAARDRPEKRSKAPRGKICPTCGDRYPAEATFCGKDATTLVLLN